MSVLNCSTSVQMVSWRPCHQTHVAVAVLSPSRLWTTCRILARTCIVPRLRSSSNLRPPLSAPTGLSGVRSNPATTTTVFASRAPASISWTRLLDVLSRSGGTVVQRWTRPTLMNYKWNLDCLHLLPPPRLLSWRHTSRPSVAWRSRLPSSTPTLSHNEGDERNAGTGWNQAKVHLFNSMKQTYFLCQGRGLVHVKHWTCDCDVLIMCCCCDHNTKPVRAASSPSLCHERSVIDPYFVVFIYQDWNAWLQLPNSVQHEPNEVLYVFCRHLCCCESCLWGGRTSRLSPSPSPPLSSEDWTLAEVQWWTPSSSCFLISSIKNLPDMQIKTDTRDKRVLKLGHPLS